MTMKEARVRRCTKEQVRSTSKGENKEATGKRGRKVDGLIKGRSKRDCGRNVEEKEEERDERN